MFVVHVFKNGPYFKKTSPYDGVISFVEFNIELVPNNYHSDYIILGKGTSDIACISVFRYGNQLEMVSALGVEHEGDM